MQAGNVPGLGRQKLSGVSVCYRGFRLSHRGIFQGSVGVCKRVERISVVLFLFNNVISHFNFVFLSEHSAPECG